MPGGCGQVCWVWGGGGGVAGGVWGGGKPCYPVPLCSGTAAAYRRPFPWGRSRVRRLRRRSKVTGSTAHEFRPSARGLRQQALATLVSDGAADLGVSGWPLASVSPSSAHWSARPAHWSAKSALLSGRSALLSGRSALCQPGPLYVSPVRSLVSPVRSVVSHVRSVSARSALWSVRRQPLP